MLARNLHDLANLMRQLYQANGNARIVLVGDGFNETDIYVEFDAQRKAYVIRPKPAVVEPPHKA